jgi:hypothetical protein
VNCSQSSSQYFELCLSRIRRTSTLSVSSLSSVTCAWGLSATKRCSSDTCVTNLEWCSGSLSVSRIQNRNFSRWQVAIPRFHFSPFFKMFQFGLASQHSFNNGRAHELLLFCSPPISCVVKRHDAIDGGGHLSKSMYQ